MTESGVLRPGNRAIRRGPGGVPLYATRPISELSHSLDVLFSSELKPDQPKMPKITLQPPVDKATPSCPSSSRFSLKGMLIGLGLIDVTNGGGGPELPSPQLQLTRLEAQIKRLESLLEAEKSLCQAQREELITLRAQINRIDVLETDLAIERESGTQLVRWLQEAEQELAGLRRIS